MHELNIKSAEIPQKRGYRGKLRSRLCIQMSAWNPPQPFAQSNVSMSAGKEYKWPAGPEQVRLLRYGRHTFYFWVFHESVLHKCVCKSYHIRPSIPSKLHVMHTLNCLWLRSSVRGEWPPRENSNRSSDELLHAAFQPIDEAYQHDEYLLLESWDQSLSPISTNKTESGQFLSSLLVMCSSSC